MEIIFKSVSSKLNPVTMEPAEFEKMKKDFLSYLKGSGEKGGVYKCSLNNKPMEIVLRFDEIVCFIQDTD